MFIFSYLDLRCALMFTFFKISTFTSFRVKCTLPSPTNKHNDSHATSIAIADSVHLTNLVTLNHSLTTLHNNNKHKHTAGVSHTKIIIIKFPFFSSHIFMVSQCTVRPGSPCAASRGASSPLIGQPERITRSIPNAQIVSINNPYTL